MDSINHAAVRHVPWNKGKLVGQKALLKQREIPGDPNPASIAA